MIWLGGWAWKTMGICSGQQHFEGIDQNPANFAIL